MSGPRQPYLALPLSGTIIYRIHAHAAMRPGKRLREKKGTGDQLSWLTLCRNLACVPPMSIERSRASASCCDASAGDYTDAFAMVQAPNGPSPSGVLGVRDKVGFPLDPSQVWRGSSERSEVTVQAGKPVWLGRPE